MIETYEDMTDLWHGSVDKMWYGTLDNGGIDHVASIDTIAYSNLLTAESMAFEFDLGRDLWLTQSRWTVLQRQYLDLGELKRFFDRSEALGLGEGKRGAVTSMQVRNVARYAKRHRWGPCMQCYTYRGVRGSSNEALRPTFSLHSRVSYIAYIGGADLALAHVVARYIARKIRVPIEEFRFQWYIDALQFHGFKSLPLLYKKKYIKDLKDPAKRVMYPTINLVGKWWDTTVRLTEDEVPLDDIKYGPHRRITRRYREYLAKDFQPSIPVAKLTLNALLTDRGKS